MMSFCGGVVGVEAVAPEAAVAGVEVLGAQQERLFGVQAAGGVGVVVALQAQHAELQVLAAA